jgi:hypothetical protein
MTFKRFNTGTALFEKERNGRYGRCVLSLLCSFFMANPHSEREPEGKKILQACDLFSITACKINRVPDIEPDFRVV